MVPIPTKPLMKLMVPCFPPKYPVPADKLILPPDTDEKVVLVPSPPTILIIPPLTVPDAPPNPPNILILPATLLVELFTIPPFILITPAFVPFEAPLEMLTDPPIPPEGAPPAYKLIAPPVPLKLLPPVNVIIPPFETVPNPSPAVIKILPGFVDPSLAPA